MKMQLKFTKPVFAQCRTCFKKYDMVEWGVDCPSCKKKRKVILTKTYSA